MLSHAGQFAPILKYPAFVRWGMDTQGTGGMVPSKPEPLNSEGSMTTMQANRELLDVGDVARMLSAGKRTVFRWAALGKMPSPVKMGGRFVRWRRADIERWIADGCPHCIEGADR